MTEAQRPARLMRLDLWVLIVLGISGIAFFLLKFNDSFPSASIDLRVSKQHIALAARDWARKAGYSPDGAIESTIFSFDDDAKTFLEYELGQRAANALMAEQVPVWTWRTRFCRPFQQEECAVGMRTNGALGYFDHSMPNDAKLPSISHVEARKLAEAFVEREARLSVTGTKLIEDSEDKKVNRVDHYFAWEDTAHDYKGGKLRTYVYVAGNQITQYNHYLHVPEKFERKFAEIRSWNELLKSVSSIIYVILSSAISFIFIWAFANGRIRWKFALIAGAMGATLSVLTWVNGWPTLVASYPTTSSSFQQFLTESLVGLLVSVLYVTVSCVVFVAALEPIYRAMFPDKVALERLFTPLALRSASVFRGLVAGLAVFGMHTAYVVAFYLFGQKVGFWSPLEVRDTATLSGLFPVYEAVNVGITASTVEELMYRVLALAIFQRLSNNFWLANFLQAASWAFMHSDYPEEPAYVRGVELTIGGLFYGWVLRRFGLLACVLAHYTYDAFLGVTPLMMSSSISDQLVSFIAIAPGVVALAASGFLIWRKGLLTDESPVLNSSITDIHKPPPARAIEPVVELDYVPLSKKARTAIIACAIVLIGLSSVTKQRVIGQNNIVTVSREQAIDLGAAYLLRNGVATKGMRSMAWMSDQVSETEMQYVFEKAKFDRTRELAKHEEPRLVWRVRFFKEMDPSEYYATLSPSGKPIGRFILKEEDAPGAKLSEAQARQLVERYLHDEHPEQAPVQFQDSTRHDRKERTDYDLQYTIPPLKVGDADYRVYASTVGGDVSGAGGGWEVPDQWTYEREKTTQKDQVFNVVRRVVSGLLAVLMLLWLIDILKSHVIRFKPAIAVGLVGAVVALLGNLNSLPTLFVSYKTEEGLQTFIMQQSVQYAIGILFTAAGMTLLAAFAYGAFRKLFPGMSIAALARPILPKGLGGAGSNRELWLDAVIIGYVLTAAVCALDYLLSAGQYLTSPAVHLYNLDLIQSVADQWSPALGALTMALSAAVMVPVCAIIIVSVGRKFLGGSIVKAIVVLAVLSAVFYSGARYWQDYLWSVGGAVVLVPIAYYYATGAARLNVLAYALTGWLVAISAVLMALMRSGYEVFFGDIAVLLVALAAPVVYTAWLFTLPRSKPD